jgi:uncharacterized C2H2 Zn-finger protein
MEDHARGHSRLDNDKAEEAEKLHKCEICDAAFEFEESLTIHFDNLHRTPEERSESKDKKVEKESHFELPFVFDEILEMKLISDDDYVPSPLTRCQYVIRLFLFVTDGETK